MADELLPLTCPECGQSDKGIRKKAKAFYDGIINRDSDGTIHNIGAPDILISDLCLYQCPECGFNTGDIRYFMPEKLEEAKEKTRQWWREHPNGCC